MEVEVKGIDYYVEKNDVEGLLRMFEELKDRVELPDSRSSDWMAATRAVACHGTVDQMRSFLDYLGGAHVRIIIELVTDILVDTLHHNNWSTFHCLRRYIPYNKSQVLVYCLCNDGGVGWFFEDIDTWGNRKNILLNVMHSIWDIEIAKTKEECAIKYFDVLETYLDGGPSENILWAYKKILKWCMRSQRADTVARSLIRHILEFRVDVSDLTDLAENPNVDRNYSLLHVAASTRDVELIRLALEFVDIAATRRLKAGRHDRTPLEVYHVIRPRPAHPEHEEIVGLLTPTPAKGAHA